MYEELVKALRGPDTKYIFDLADEAADAIESLCKELERKDKIIELAQQTERQVLSSFDASVRDIKQIIGFLIKREVAITMRRDFIADSIIIGMRKKGFAIETAISLCAKNSVTPGYISEPTLSTMADDLDKAIAKKRGGTERMSKNEFRQWIYDNYNVPGNNCTLAPNMLNGILDYAEEMEAQERFEFFCCVFPSFPSTVLRSVSY